MPVIWSSSMVNVNAARGAPCWRHAWLAVDDRQFGRPCPSGEGFGDASRPDDFLCACGEGHRIGVEGCLWVQQGDERRELSLLGGGQEGVDDLPAP